MKKKKTLFLAICFLVVYIGLLLLLTFFESASADANITSPVDALWYSLVTMTTVGYGDFFPVTPGGRIVGFVFLLLSIGFLAFLVSALTGMILSRVLPYGRLYLQKSAFWYIFDGVNEESRLLAQALLKERPDAICIFCCDTEESLSDKRMLLCKDSVEGVLKFHGSSGKQVLIYQTADEEHNFKEGCTHPASVSAVAKTRQHPDQVPANLILFDPYENVARQYWEAYPICSPSTPSLKQDIVLIGDGIFAQNLLERALFTNVYGSDQSITYHLYGDWEHFLRNHYCLDDALPVIRDGKASDSEPHDTGDRILLHSEDWNSDPELLLTADRILISYDEDDTNRKLLGEIRRYFPTQGQVHVHLTRPQEGEITFGSLENVYTAEAVLKYRLQKTARTMHEQYRNSADYAVPAWEDLSEFLRQSNLAVADHLMTKVRILLPDREITELTAENCRAAWEIYQSSSESRKKEFRKIEHMRWERFHYLHNWSYAPVRDNAKRKHPLLLPFEELAESNQSKDDFAWELIRQFAER